MSLKFRTNFVIDDVGNEVIVAFPVHGPQWQRLCGGTPPLQSPFVSRLDEIHHLL